MPDEANAFLQNLLVSEKDMPISGAQIIDIEDEL